MNDEQAAQVAKALGHPLRIALLREVRGWPDFSPVEYARESEESLGNVSYHVRALLEADVIVPTDGVARRGALEHRYALSGRGAEVALAVLDLLATA